MQDLIRLGNWTINAGLRWDHYQLIVNKQSFDPRLAISRYFPKLGLSAHFSYDRVFQTPSFENILLSNSFEVSFINPDFLRSPSSPRREITTRPEFRRRFGNNLRADVNYYLRNVNNYADDDQIENTTISFPIAFRKALIYGAEAKIEVPNWHGLSGFVSYSYMVGNVWFPVTGGSVSGRRRAGRRKPNHRPLSGFAGPAQYAIHAMGLSSEAAFLDCRRSAVWQRVAI